MIMWMFKINRFKMINKFVVFEKKNEFCCKNVRKC